MNPPRPVADNNLKKEINGLTEEGWTGTADRPLCSRLCSKKHVEQVDLYTNATND